MIFPRIQFFMVMALMATMLSAFAGAITANFTSASTIPVMAASYTATGNDVNLSIGFAPPTGTNLTVVKNTGLAFISGRFSNLAQGQKIGLTDGGLTYEFVANYYGGSGNDLVLQWAYRDAYAWGQNNYAQLGNNSTTNSSVPVAVTTTGVLAGKTVLSVASGSAHSLALCSDGTVAAWGPNYYGQLGNNSTTDSRVPVAVTISGVLAGKTVVAVAAGGYHSLALCSDGTVAAWGNNYSGQLGNNSTTNSSVPVAVTTTGVLAGKTVVAVAAGNDHSLALCSDGTVAAWGINSSGQLGNNSTTNSRVPVAVTTTGVLAGKTVVAVAAGAAHSLALCSDGTVAAWGYNGNGQLGTNSTTNSSVPAAVTTTGVLAGKTVVAVAAGDYHNLALCSDGTVAAWGQNTYGQLGNNSTTNSSVPVAVTTTGVLAGKTVVALAAKVAHSLALCSDGTDAAWGQNTYGQLGNNSTTNSSVPVAVTTTGVLAGKTVVAVAAGSLYSLAIAASPLSADTTLSSLTLDSSALTPAFAPTTATYSASVPNSTTSVVVTPSVTNSYATVKVNGTTVSKGSSSAAIPLTVGSNTISVVVTAQNGIASSAYTIDVLRTSDLNFTYTAADQAAITFPAYAATGNAVNLSLGFAPQTGTDLSVVKNTGIGFIGGKFNNLAQGQKIGLTYGGLTYEFVANYYGGSGNDLVLQWAHRDAYAWGRNAYGQLGNNSRTNSSVPVAVTNTGVLSGKTVVAVATGDNHSLALCSDGTVAAWGSNGNGQLGNNSTTDSSVPVAVANTGVLAGKTVVAVAAGSAHSLALCSDGTVAAWGANYFGQLGNNSTTNSSVPVAVTTTGVLAGKTVVAVAAGSAHSLALCSDGTVAAWGINSNGELGNNSTTNSSVPVAVANTGALAGKTVLSVEAGNGHNLALCSDSTIAAWGSNDYGQLGNSSTTSSSVPVAVANTGALAGKTVVALAAYSHSLALCSDGTVAAWGINSSGQLGNNSTTNSSVPVAVANTGVLAGKTVVAVAAEYYRSLALCSDGTVAAWGLDNGLVPIAVANTGVLAGKTVVSVAAGYFYSLAIVANSPMADSTLSSLTLDSLPLNPVFAPKTATYSASVSNSTTSVMVTPTVTNFYAKVKVNGTTVSSGSDSGAIPLAVGINTISVVVTAQNGINSSTYTIDILRTSDLNLTYTAADQTVVTFRAYAATGNAVNLSLGFAPPSGTNLTVVKNTGMGFIEGKFNNLAQGQKIGLTYGGFTYEFIADYYGGSGNDLVLRWAHRDAYAWGPNSYGKLGNNSTTDSSVPVAVANTGILAGKTVVAVAGGYAHSLALCSDGTVAAWGYNANGQLGNNSTTDSSVPVAVDSTGILDGKTVVAVAGGDYHSLALCSDGTVAAWGYNAYGQLGNNSTAYSSVPVVVNATGVLAGKTVVSVVGGEHHSLALCSDGTVAAWGSNGIGQLGNNSTTDSSVPVVVTTTGVLDGKTVVSVAGGAAHSLALCSDGTVAAWGYNAYGQLGNNSTAYSSVPVVVASTELLAGKTVVSVAAGYFYSLALCSDGTVAAWGSNGNGQLGNGSTIESSVPVAVANTGVLAGKTVVAVAAGGSDSLALCSDGTVAAWGYNANGQLGNNSTTDSSVPVAVANTGALAGKTVVAVAAGGSHSLAIVASSPTASTLSSLTLDCSAVYPAFAPTTAAYSASVSNSTTSVMVTPTVTNSYAKVKVNGTTVSSGSASTAIPLTVGSNTITVMVTAQDGRTTSGYTLTVMRAPSSVCSLAGLTLSSGTLSPAFTSGTFAYTASVLSSVKSLQVTPTVTDSTASVKVNGLAVASGSASLPISLSAGNNPIQVVVTAQDGTTISNYTATVFVPSADATLSGLTCNSGSLSPAYTSGTTAYAVNVANDCTGVTLTPTLNELNATVRVNGNVVSSGTASVKIPVLASGNNVINVAVTAQDGTRAQAYAVTVNRPPLSGNFASATTVPLSVSSYDASGNFANLSLGYAPTPGTTLTLVRVTGLDFIQGRFTNLAQGQYVSLAYQGVVYRFAVNYYGGTGNDLVLQWANDKAYAWGANSYGQLGNNGTSNSSLPTSVLGSGALSGKTVVAASAGSFHSLALCADGTLAAWGRNDLGQLGDNSTTSSSVPVAITNSGALSGKMVVAISAGYYHNLVLCSDGTMVAWGQNTYGQLGDGSKTNRSVPVAVSAAGGVSGKTVSGIAAGYYHNLAQCTDGSLVAWGRNSYGQLGNNSTTDSSTPVDITRSGVLNGLTVAQFAAGSDHSLVLCTDGSLAAWGRNNYGQLGEGSGANSSVPVEVDSTDVLAGKIVTSISAGGWHNLALCSDGTLAAFGRNTSGQLGDGGTTNSGLPLVANLSGLGGKAIAAVQAANGHSLALCADGSIYAWGSSSNGQLGNGGTTNSSLPVTVTTSPLGSGERFMTLTTGTSASHSMALVAVPPTNTGFSVWAASHAGLSDSTALGDPDKDGIPNVLEYVLNGNPAVASAAVLPMVSQNASSFLFSFSRAAASAEDTTQVFQYSTNLSSWTEVSLTPPTDAKVTLGAVDSAGIQPVTVTIPKQGDMSMFGRLKVVKP